MERRFSVDEPKLINAGQIGRIAPEGRLRYLWSMLASTSTASCNWLCSGQEIFPAMLEAIERAQSSVRLESYIYEPEALGIRFLEALVRAQNRGVRTRVLVDAFGSINLPATFWDPLRAAGGQARQFNPLSLSRFGIRNHRKSLICDEQVAFIGGFNIAQEYDGDGITHGWHDVGVKLAGPLVADLAAAFDEMFGRADFQHKSFLRLRRFSVRKTVLAPDEQLLLSGPGRGRSPIKSALRHDLSRANDARIMVAYFLPTWRIRHALMRVARRGGRVQLILAGKSDVVISQLAARSLYHKLLKAGVEIYEYQPQILHAKLMVVDQVAYVGSANLDPRSLNINFELMLRLQNPQVAAQARLVFESSLQHCSRITFEQWRKSRSLWSRLRERWAYFLLVRLDPYIARRQWRGLSD